MNWKALIAEAYKQKAYTDRTGRRCHELRDQLIVAETAKQARSLLEAVRKLGWYYPTDDELKSIMLDTHNQHLYSYSEKIAEELPRIVALLRANPHTRRAVIHLTDPERGDSAHTPALLSATLWMKGKSLCITGNARSTDLLVGLPANLYQLSMLLEYCAEQLDMKTGAVCLFTNSAHVFADMKEPFSEL